MNCLEIVFRLSKTQERGAKTPSRFLCAKTMGIFREYLLVCFNSKQKFSIKFLLLAELDPIVLAALLGWGYAVRDLRTNMDLFRGRPIVFAFCLSQHDRTMLIPKFKSVLLLRSWQSHFMRPHPLRQETSGLNKNSLIAVSDPQRSIFHG